MAQATERLFRNPEGKDGKPGAIVSEAQAEWGATLAYAEGDEIDQEDRVPSSATSKQPDKPAKPAPERPGGTIEISNPVKAPAKTATDNPGTVAAVSPAKKG